MNIYLYVVGKFIYPFNILARWYFDTPYFFSKFRKIAHHNLGEFLR